MTEEKLTLNGRGCPLVQDDWNSHRNDLADVREGITELLRHTQHLAHLPRVAEGVEELNQRIEGVRNDLIGPATSADRVPLKVVEWLAKAQSVVILVLVVVIGFLLTGEKMGWINELHK